MRVLLTHHRGLGECPSGLHTLQLAQALAAAHHDVRCLIVDGHAREEDEGLRVRRIVCSAREPNAELPFDVPGFKSDSNTARTFSSLHENEISSYRNAIRNALDAEVHSFDPHVIHAQHIWLQAQLALETGVPYVVTAWGPELDEYQSDSRFQPMADQAAENAGRILLAQAALRDTVAGMFPAAGDRLEVLSIQPHASEPCAPGAKHCEPVMAKVIAVYEQVLNQRFGNRTTRP